MGEHLPVTGTPYRTGTWHLRLLRKDDIDDYINRTTHSLKQVGLKIFVKYVLFVNKMCRRNMEV